MNRKTGLVFALLFLFTQLYYCAKIESPPGGPPDTTPPEIISATPTMGQLGVSAETEIRIGFSEKISKEEVASQIFIVPPPEETPNYSWKGKELIISFPDNLENNRTYLITLKTGLRDLRRNKLAKPFKLAFSTGEYLDSGWISGMVYQDLKPAAGVDIWAFEYDSSFTLFDNQPIYITQTTDSGEYKLEYLAEGEYLCCAVRDKAGNRKYDPEEDYIGLPDRLIIIDSANPFHSGLNFDLQKRDTTALKIISAEFTDDLMFSVKLSKEVYSPFISVQNFEINNADDQTDVAISKLYTYADTSDKIMLVPGSLPDPGNYMVRIKNIYDLLGNGIGEGLDTLSFELTAQEDTDPPRLVSSYPAENEKAFPIDSDFAFIFSEPIMVDSVDTALLYLMDTDSTLMYGFKCAADELMLRCQAAEQLKSGQSFTLFLNLPGIYDLTAGNPAGDSVLSYSFDAENKDEYGAISGKLAEGKTFGAATVSLFIMGVDGRHTYPLIFDDSLTFALDLPAGKYIVHGYDDRNGDNLYDWGRLDPPGYSEPLLIFPDTISVRSRFETEDIILNLP